LYLEIGKSSEATFGVYLKFNLLGQELLTRGGVDYLMDYIKGASHTMDTGLYSGKISLPRDQAATLLAYFDKKRATTKDAEELKLLNEFIRRRLEYHANK